MAKETILRVLEGVTLPNAVFASLGKLLNGYKIEYFSQKPNHEKIYADRIDSLHQAFLFLLEAYPVNPKFTNLTADTLKKYAANCRNACDLRYKSVDELEGVLGKFTTQLVNVIAVAWKWPKDTAQEDAKHCLNEAEQFMLMGKGRPDVATIIPMDLGKQAEFVMQWDKSEPPYYDLLIKELKQIMALKFPKTIPWYRKLPECQQVYFANLTSNITNANQVVLDLNNCIALLKPLSEKKEFDAEMQNIAQNKVPLPTWFKSLAPQLKEMVKALADEPHTCLAKITQFRADLNEYNEFDFFDNFVEKAPKIPHWYWVLSNQQQFFLQYVLTTAEKNKQSIEDAISFIPSRLRVLPLPANYGKHSLHTLNSQGEIVQHFDNRRRSSHIVSREGLDDWPQSVQKRHSQSNLSVVMKDAPSDRASVFITNVSPVPGPKKVLWWKLPPDWELEQGANQAVSQSPQVKNILQVNHPLNIYRYVGYTTSTSERCWAILNEGKKHLTKKPELESLLTEYQAVIESKPGSATFNDYEGRELFLSSLGHLIILTTGGLSYGSCVSGKDRKACELIHTDAMILYRLKNGYWPKFGDPKDQSDRQDFVNIVAGLYCSKHQQILAGQNAPGSEAIKTPDTYFPKDIAEAIKTLLGDKKALKNDEKEASNNEVKHICKASQKHWVPENKLYFQLLALQFGEENCNRLYDALCHLINERSAFISNTGSMKGKTFFSTADTKKMEAKLPPGILAMLELTSKGTDKKSNLMRLPLLLEIGRDQEDSGDHTEATTLVYSSIRELLSCPISEQKKVIDKVVEAWKDAFENSKEENRRMVASL